MDTNATADRMNRKNPADIRLLRTFCKLLFRRGARKKGGGWDRSSVITRSNNPTGERIDRKERNDLREEASERAFVSAMAEWTASGHTELKDWLDFREKQAGQVLSSMQVQQSTADSNPYVDSLLRMARTANDLQSAGGPEIAEAVDWIAFLIPNLQRLFDALFSRCEGA